MKFDCTVSVITVPAPPSRHQHLYNPNRIWKYCPCKSISFLWKHGLAMRKTAQNWSNIKSLAFLYEERSWQLWKKSIPSCVQRHYRDFCYSNNNGNISHSECSQRKSMFCCLGLVSESPQLDLSNLYCRKYTNSGVYMTKQAYELYFFFENSSINTQYSSRDVGTLPIFSHGIWIILGYMNQPGVWK